MRSAFPPPPEKRTTGARRGGYTGKYRKGKKGEEEVNGLARMLESLFDADQPFSSRVYPRLSALLDPTGEGVTKAKFLSKFGPAPTHGEFSVCACMRACVRMRACACVCVVTKAKFLSKFGPVPTHGEFGECVCVCVCVCVCAHARVWVCA